MAVIQPEKCCTKWRLNIKIKLWGTIGVLSCFIVLNHMETHKLNFKKSHIHKPPPHTHTHIQGDQNVSVRLMITIQKVTINVQSVPCQSPDIYRHAELCSRRLYPIQHGPHSECILWWPPFLRVFFTVIISCIENFWSAYMSDNYIPPRFSWKGGQAISQLMQFWRSILFSQEFLI
jgi:hypothetical protein